MDDPQLRAKLETLMLVYPGVTVARALHFLDEASAMLDEAQADQARTLLQRAEWRSGERVSEQDFARIVNDDDTQQMDEIR